MRGSKTLAPQTPSPQTGHGFLVGGFKTWKSIEIAGGLSTQDLASAAPNARLLGFLTFKV